MLEVKSIVAGNTCIELGLKPDDSNLMVLSFTLFGFTPAPDLEEVRAFRNILERLVPFTRIVVVDGNNVSGEYALVVQLVWDLDFLSMNLGAIGVLVTNDTDTCGKGAPFSLN